MRLRRCLKALTPGCALALTAGCGTAPPPPAMVRPASFIPLGVNAPYLSGR